MSSRSLAVVMDPISTIQYKKDTTLALLWAAQEHGFSLLYMEQKDLWLDSQQQATGRVRPLKVFRDPSRWYELGDPLHKQLGSIDVILMRKDPPFDMSFIYSTYLLEQAEKQGALVVNRPVSLRDCNEKLFATHFPQCCPPLIVSSLEAEIRAFAKQQGDIILKPLDGMGGQGIFRIMTGDPNLGSAIELLSHHGRLPIMAQRYLPEISQGDKRILMVNGEPVPYCLARIPQAGESRGNLAAGGYGQVRPLSRRDQWIAAHVGPELVKRGLLFVGLDVIGDYLTEINVTSPTCLREIEAAETEDGKNKGIADKLMIAIKNLIKP